MRSARLLRLLAFLAIALLAACSTDSGLLSRSSPADQEMSGGAAIPVQPTADAEGDVGTNGAEVAALEPASDLPPELMSEAMPEPPPVAEAAAPEADQPEPPLLAEQRRLCARQGGALRQRVTGAFACVQLTRDADQRCTGPRDCEGDCLARSGTCAPFRPLFGCHEVLLGPSSRVTQCID